MILRSLLFVPAHKEKLIKKALKTDADALIFDLEDSCPGEENRKTGRKLILKYIRPERDFVRIASISDVIELSRYVLGFMIPKIECPKEIDNVIKKLMYCYTYNLIPLIESCRGIMNAHSICGHHGILAVAFGSEDYKADLMGNGIHFARNMIVNAAKANNIIPIDTVHVNVHDLQDLEYDLRISKSLGFEGMLCLHPKELELVHKYYTPSDRKVEYARKRIKIYEESDGGVAIMDEIYIAPPMYKYDKKLIKRYEEIQRLQNRRKNNS